MKLIKWVALWLVGQDYAAIVFRALCELLQLHGHFCFFAFVSTTPTMMLGLKIS